jgi:hypothetical protein
MQLVYETSSIPAKGVKVHATSTSLEDTASVCETSHISNDSSNGKKSS